MRKDVLILGVLCLLSATVMASPQTSGASQISVQNPQPQERKEITVPEEILKTYVGEYEFAPEESLKITFENGSLWGQPPGSAKRQMFADSETKFFVKTSPTEVTFQKDEKGNVVGLIMKSGPRPEIKLKKVK